MNLLVAAIVLVAVAYIGMLLTSVKQKEGFVANLLWLPDTRPNSPNDVIMEQNFAAPYVTTPIYSVDDYELNLISQYETDKEISKEEINRLTAQRPMDWSNQPPNSSVFQKGFAEMRQRDAAGKMLSAPASLAYGKNATDEAQAIEESKASRRQQIRQDSMYNNEGFQDTASGVNPYGEIDGSSLQPPDTSATEMEERKILQTYKPTHSESLTTYDLEDANKLIKKIYDAKGLVPTVVQKPNNVFEVVGVRKKDEKIIYEDEEAPAKMSAVASAGEATITVPPTSADINVGLDPFFTPGPKGRTNRWDYTKPTSGLERSMAPTFAQENWS